MVFQSAIRPFFQLNHRRVSLHARDGLGIPPVDGNAPNLANQDCRLTAMVAENSPKEERGIPARGDRSPRSRQGRAGEQRDRERHFGEVRLAGRLARRQLLSVTTARFSLDAFEIQAAPRMDGHAPSGDQTEPVSEVQVTFHDAILAGTFTRDDVAIVGPDGAVGVLGAPSWVSGNTYRISFPPQAAYGLYHVYVGPTCGTRCSSTTPRTTTPRPPGKPWVSRASMRTCKSARSRRRRRAWPGAACASTGR